MLVEMTSPDGSASVVTPLAHVERRERSFSGSAVIARFKEVRPLVEPFPAACPRMLTVLVAAWATSTPL